MTTVLLSWGISAWGIEGLQGRRLFAHRGRKEGINCDSIFCFFAVINFCRKGCQTCDGGGLCKEIKTYFCRKNETHNKTTTTTTSTKNSFLFMYQSLSGLASHFWPPVGWCILSTRLIIFLQLYILLKFAWLSTVKFDGQLPANLSCQLSSLQLISLTQVSILIETLLGTQA